MSKRSLPILFLLTVLFLSLLVVSAGAQPAVEGPPNPDPARLPQSGRHEHSFAATADTNGLPLSSWQRVAYQKWANDNWDIYLYDSNGSTRLTTNPAADYFPSLNRGGTMVAFSSGRDEPDGQLNLYTMNVDKSNLQRIVTGWTAFPAWSPDGKTIALQLWIDNNYEIFLVDADGSNLRRLTNNPDFDGQPAWSPDGKKIAFASSRNGAYAIYLMNADGSSQNQLSTFALSLHPTWSPDGQYIGFDADVDNDGWQELALIKRNGSDEQMIYNPGSTATSWAGSWSPDGKTLGFANISLTQSGSNWVWTEGEILEWDMENGSVTNLVPGVTNWYLDWETLDTIPPTTFLYEMREYSRADTFWMAWMGSDLGGSGIKNYSVYYRSSSMGTWQTYWGNTVATEAPFPGIPGETVDFLVRARDNAYNVGPWRDQPTDTTTFYRTKIGGKVVDNRGTPLESVAIDITPAPMFPAVTNELGEFAGYTIDPGDYTLSINQTGYLPTPSTNIADNEDFERNITLLPADTLFLNGTFEASGFLPIGWQTAGGMNVGITAQQRATGKYSVRMAAATSQAAQSTNAIVTGDLLQQVTIPASMPSPTLSFLASAAGDQFGDGTRLEVIVLPDGGSEIVVKPIGLLEEKWNHYWVDLQAFSGLKVDIIFRTTQDSTDPGITVFLDDISLGSAEPELWLGMSSLPRSAIMGDLVTIEIAYGNRGGVAANGVIMDVTLDNSLGVINTIPPATQNGFDLQWNLPDLAAKSGPEKLLINAFVAGNPPQAMKVEGEITSAVAETHTVNNRAELFIGNQREVLLPVIGGAPQ